MGTTSQDPGECPPESKLHKIKALVVFEWTSGAVRILIRRIVTIAILLASAAGIAERFDISQKILSVFVPLIAIIAVLSVIAAHPPPAEQSIHPSAAALAVTPAQ